jgi:hypothetical protein
MIKNFEVLRVIEEADGNLGVDFCAFQGSVNDEKPDGIEEMRGSLSFPPDSDIEAEIFALIKDDWT